MSNVWYLALGFGAVWLLVGAYLLYLARRQAILVKRLDELEKAEALLSTRHSSGGG